MSTAGRQDSRTVALRKDLEEDDRVPHVNKGGVEVEVKAEASPDGPGLVVGGSSLKSDAMSGRFLRSAEVTEERISGLGWTKRQDVICG